jgi:hypothetical protein
LKAFEKGDKMVKSTSIKTVESWGAKVSEGGLPWNTYKATCKRNGFYVTKNKKHEFNRQL